MSADSSAANAARSNRLPRWVNTLLVVLIGYSLALLSLKALQQDDATASTALLQGQSAPAIKTSLVDLMGIGSATAATHLFGNAAVAPAPVKTATAAPPVVTKLNLKLVGVFAYEPQNRAIAIIGTSEGETAYRVGDKIIGETKLKAVYTDRVILDNRGKDEILRLPENVTPIASRQPQIQRSTNNVSNSGGQSNGPVDLPSTPGALRDTLAKNPALLGRVVAAEPYQENGKLVGYRITPKQNPEILEAQGIVAGDIITRVNNIELNSQKQGIRALRNAVKAQNLEVTILRDGVQIPLSISLSE